MHQCREDYEYGEMLRAIIGGMCDGVNENYRYADGAYMPVVEDILLFVNRVYKDMLREFPGLE